jgi:hypothetical protein
LHLFSRGKVREEPRQVTVVSAGASGWTTRTPTPEWGHALSTTMMPMVADATISATTLLMDCLQACFDRRGISYLTDTVATAVKITVDHAGNANPCR